MLAELMGMPCVSSIAKFERSGETCVVERDIEGGARSSRSRCLQCSRPTRAERAALRLAQGHHGGEEEAARREAGPARRANLEVTTLALPAARAAGRIVGQGAAAIPELVRLLREEAKLL